MHLQLTTHNLEVSFTCDNEDYYDHTTLLSKIAELIEELDNHSAVDLVITSKVDHDEDSEETSYDND